MAIGRETMTLLFSLPSAIRFGLSTLSRRKYSPSVPNGSTAGQGTVTLPDHRAPPGSGGTLTSKGGISSMSSLSPKTPLSESQTWAVEAGALRSPKLSTVNWAISCSPPCTVDAVRRPMGTRSTTRNWIGSDTPQLLSSSDSVTWLATSALATT